MCVPDRTASSHPPCFRPTPPPTRLLPCLARTLPKVPAAFMLWALVSSSMIWSRPRQQKGESQSHDVQPAHHAVPSSLAAPRASGWQMQLVHHVQHPRVSSCAAPGVSPCAAPRGVTKSHRPTTAHTGVWGLVHAGSRGHRAGRIAAPHASWMVLIAPHANPKPHLTLPAPPPSRAPLPHRFDEGHGAHMVHLLPPQRRLEHRPILGIPLQAKLRGGAEEQANERASTWGSRASES